MKRINAADLVSSLLPSAENANPENDLFLSSFNLKGEDDCIKADIRNIFIRPDFTLNLTQITFKQDVEFANEFPTELVGFTFCLKGKCLFKIPINNENLSFEDGISTVYKTVPHIGYSEFKKGMTYFSVAIHLSVNKFLEITGEKEEVEKSDFLSAVKQQGAHKLYSFPFKSNVRLLLESILKDDLKGLSKQFFIESKVLEIIGCQLEELNLINSKTNLKEPDLAKIIECEKIIRSQYSAPHSLLKLAKEVGLNDFKLKQGFKQVFGKPVFKYLQEYRLEKARDAIKNSQKSIGEIAEDIGYNSQSSFSNAFFEQFGVRPTKIR